MVETVADRARSAAVEAELERYALEAQRLDRGRAHAAELASRAVGAWCETERLERVTCTLGDPEPLGVHGRWRVPVTFPAPSPDDDLRLLLELEVDDIDHLAWWIPRSCARCLEPYAVPAGWSLAELGRALDDRRLHECEPPPWFVVETIHLPAAGSDPRSCDGRLADRMTRLTEAGYVLETHLTDGFVVLVGQRHPLRCDEPF